MRSSLSVQWLNHQFVPTSVDLCPFWDTIIATCTFWITQSRVNRIAGSRSSTAHSQNCEARRQQKENRCCHAFIKPVLTTAPWWLGGALHGQDSHRRGCEKDREYDHSCLSAVDLRQSDVPTGNAESRSRRGATNADREGALRIISRQLRDLSRNEPRSFEPRYEMCE